MYEAEINRATPACIMFLIDQSGSMHGAIGGGAATKQQVVADALNRLLNELVSRCVRTGGKIYDFFHVGVVCYGRTVGPALAGELAGRPLVTVSELAHHPIRVESHMVRRTDENGGVYEYPQEEPVWLEPAAQGGTPMTKALDEAHGVLNTWVEEHPRSYPPIVLNLTDGDSTDGDPTDAGTRIRSLSTHDGPALLFNMHISSERHAPVQFPASADGLPDSGRLLFGMSSPLPDRMRSYATGELGLAMTRDSRGFVYNADITSIVQFLDVGTRPAYHLDGMA